MCRACHGQWFSDMRFEARAIEKVIGTFTDLEAEHRAYTAEATKRTAAWVSERKARRVA